MASRTLVEDARAKGAGGRLVTGMVILVAADIVGGAAAVLVDANTLGGGLEQQGRAGRTVADDPRAGQADLGSCQLA